MALSLKALDGLIKIHKRNIDIQKAKLSNLAKELLTFQGKLIEIDQTIKNEKTFFTSLNDKLLIGMSNALDSFLKIELQKQENLIIAIVTLHEEIKKLQEALVAENQEMRKYEIIKTKELERQNKALKIKEEKILDEIILNKYNKTLY